MHKPEHENHTNRQESLIGIAQKRTDILFSGLNDVLLEWPENGLQRKVHALQVRSSPWKRGNKRPVGSELHSYLKKDRGKTKCMGSREYTGFSVVSISLNYTGRGNSIEHSS